MQSWNLGGREVSGLGLRRDPRSGLDEVLAISDRTTTSVRLSADGPAWRVLVGVATHANRATCT